MKRAHYIGVYKERLCELRNQRKMKIWFLLFASISAWGHISKTADQMIRFSLAEQIRHRQLIYSAIRKVRRLPYHQRKGVGEELKVRNRTGNVFSSYLPLTWSVCRPKS